MDFGSLMFHRVSTAASQQKATNLQPTRKKGIAPVSSNAEKEPLRRVSESDIYTSAVPGQLPEDSRSRAVRRWLHRQTQSRQGLMTFCRPVVASFGLGDSDEVDRLA